MAAFLKSLSRFLHSTRPAPQLHLAAFGKHPGWNDHIDDLGLDTDPLVHAKRLLYIQGISQNIDSGAWEALEPPATGTSIVGGVTRLEAFCHDFLWHITTPEPTLLAGRIFSSADGKGRDKYPMVLCAQLIELPDTFAAQTVFPFLVKLHARCAAAATADDVRSLLDAERANLRALINPDLAPANLSPSQLVAIANHADMLPNREGFHRIVYQFVRGMSAYRPLGASTSSRTLAKRPEQIRVPTCGLSPADALVFWLRFALTLLDPATPILLFAPDQGTTAPWIDLIVGEPAPANLFCIKAGTKSLPLTSDIPYTLDPSFTAAVNHYLEDCTAAPPSSLLPPWPQL